MKKTLILALFSLSRTLMVENAFFLAELDTNLESMFGLLGTIHVIPELVAQAIARLLLFRFETLKSFSS